VSLAEVVTEVLAGPSGPAVGAFFDFDGTVIDGYSAGDFYRHRLRRFEIGPVEAAQTLVLGLRGVTSEEDFERFVALGFAAWAGRSEDELTELGERLFAQQIAGRLYPGAWQLIRAHERMGHTLVLASSASRFQVEPAARAVGIAHVLCTPVEVTADGILTGRSAGPTLWRQGKANAVRAFAADNSVDLPSSYAYSNGDEDIPFLSAAGHPRAVNPGGRLLAHALEEGWPVLSFAGRGRPGAAQVARTAAAYGGMVTAMATGVAFGLLNRSQRVGLDTTTTLLGELGLSLAGVRLRVSGEQNLWDHRPAVFLFNHQSQLDMAILCKLMREGVTAVAKKELASHPMFGLAFRIAGVAFVDRDGHGDARQALEPAVQRLRDGISVVIAPEGTRSVTPALGQFKKGAFHMAMQAGVPVVPIVIRNSGEMMWRDAITIRPGVVDVVVHPAVDVSAWTTDELAKRVAEVRQLYADTLASWPSPGPGAEPGPVPGSGVPG
jgi:putative phosphoserine phosphatase / 1-acylglycerol-3-phosphate O-acyltransferase